MTPSNEFEMPDSDELTPTSPSGSEPNRESTSEPVEPHGVSGPTRTPASAHREPSSSSPAPAILAAVLGLVVAGAVGASWYLGYWPFEEKNRPETERPAVASTEPNATSENAEPVIPPPSAIQADEDRVSRNELQALSNRLSTLQKRVDKQPQAPSVDLQPLESRISALETLPDAIQTLTSKVQDIDDRLIKAETSIENLESRLQDLQTEATQTQTTQTPSADDTVSSDDELQKGVDLFQQGRYREAREVFDHLTQTTAPNDARGWYFDALATGLSTGDWKEAAPRLARKGVEREKAGTPSSEKIDEALEDLTKPTGRDWIASYRNRVNP